MTGLLKVRRLPDFSGKKGSMRNVNDRDEGRKRESGAKRKSVKEWSGRRKKRHERKKRNDSVLRKEKKPEGRGRRNVKMKQGKEGKERSK